VLKREQHGEIHPRRRLRHRWRSTWGRFRARRPSRWSLADLAGRGILGSLAVLGLLVVPWVLGCHGLLGLQPLLAILAVLAHHCLQLVLELRRRIPPMGLVLLGLLALLAILAVHCFLVVLVGLALLAVVVRLHVLALLGRLAVRWVLVGLVGQPDLLGMGGMGLGQPTGTPTARGVLGHLAVLGRLGVLADLAGRAVLGRRAVLRSSTPSRSLQSYGPCGCGPWGCS